jgi:hypothetical protein
MKNQTQKAITNCTMTKLNLTYKEKLLIFDACDSDVFSLSLYPVSYKSNFTFYFTRESILRNHYNRDNFIRKMEEQVYEYGFYDKYKKNVNFKSFFNKLENFTGEDMRQLFNEIFAFWNKETLKGIAEYWQCLLENTEVKN